MLLWWLYPHVLVLVMDTYHEMVTDQHIISLKQNNKAMREKVIDNKQTSCPPSLQFLKLKQQK